MELITKEKKQVYGCPDIKDIIVLAPFLGTINDALEVFNRANGLAKEYNVRVNVSDTIQVKIPIEDAKKILGILLTLGFKDSNNIGLTEWIPEEKIMELAMREAGFHVIAGNVVYHDIETAALNGIEYDNLPPRLREMTDKDDYDLYLNILNGDYHDCNENDNDDEEEKVGNTTVENSK